MSLQYGGGCTGGMFKGDSRAIALEFSLDGFAIFHHNTSKPYPIEQLASIILNLPPELRTKPGLVLLHGLILYGESTITSYKTNFALESWIKGFLHSAEITLP